MSNYPFWSANNPLFNENTPTLLSELLVEIDQLEAQKSLLFVVKRSLQSQINAKNQSIIEDKKQLSPFQKELECRKEAVLNSSYCLKVCLRETGLLQKDLLEEYEKQKALYRQFLDHNKDKMESIRQKSTEKIDQISLLQAQLQSNDNELVQLILQLTHYQQQSSAWLGILSC